MKKSSILRTWWALRFAVIPSFPLTLVLLASLCHGMSFHLSFDQVIQKADVIFLGKVVDQQNRYGTDQKMIFTDVTFDVEELIYRKPTSEPISGREIVLSFAGGRMGEESIRVSGVPSFETGKRYLMLIRRDGKTYASPVIGSSQGLFKIIDDELTKVRYPLTYGGRCITGIRDGNLSTGPPVARIWDGAVEAKVEKARVRPYTVAPEVIEGIGAEVSSVAEKAGAAPAKIMTLEDLLRHIYSAVGTP
jgi:hypothetical protein